MLQEISVSGARQHNLKNISVRIPRNSLTVITGLSGSGKSSLAFDTIYAEGQRRYVETLSTYARQFLDQMERPDVDSIEGLSPSISIDQKTTGRSPRSTVGTITEIYDYLRLLYSSIGIPHCPSAAMKSRARPRNRFCETCFRCVRTNASGDGADRAWPQRRFKKELEKLARQGFVKRARVDGTMRSLDEEIASTSAGITRLKLSWTGCWSSRGIEKRLEASIETATKLANGLVLISVVDGEERLYSRKLACVECGTSVPELEPRSFSFNSPYGACEECSGIGSTWAFDPDKVIADPSKPLLEGGLGPGAGSSLVIHRVQAAAKTLRIKLKTPWEKLTRETRETLLNGSGTFPGHSADIAGIYRDASADYREWLTDYMSPVTCPAAAASGCGRPASPCG
jgi:excinuclease ABC subunit A